MPARVSPVEQLRAQIDELFASEQDLGQVLEQGARLSVRLVMRLYATKRGERPRSLAVW